MQAASDSVPEASEKSFTPREIVSELDKFIVGQTSAKRAVAVALRNRWRRRRVPEALRDEIAPKNIILIGSTGVGKTEIARRLAKLAQAPFVKVEASKFTEVGYVGRDVDSIVRDLIETSVRMVREEAKETVMVKARAGAEERLLDLLLPTSNSKSGAKAGARARGPLGLGLPRFERPLATPDADADDAHDAGDAAAQGAVTDSDGDGGGSGAAPADGKSRDHSDASRERLRKMLRSGLLDDRQVEVQAEDKPASVPSMQVLTSGSMEDMGAGLQEMMGQIMGRRTRKRKVPVPEALELLAQQEAAKLIDQDAVQREAVRRAEQNGIVFLDEIDKVARGGGGGGGSGSGPDVSREGVQRDILPIVEGSAVTTKYGVVRTDHVLFIAAGAFHVSKVSDLIPELQGRFPIRVELDSLGESELLQILKEPQNALPIQYTALLETEGVTLNFTAEGLAALASIAAEANVKSENIGARRLHTVMERLLEEVSFHAPEREGQTVEIDAAYVQERLASVLKSEDLARYIL